jgi:hypothetical protein
LADLMRLSLKRKAHTRLCLVLRGRKSGYAPDEQTKSVVPHLRRSTACLWTPALPGWADFWCRPSGPGLQTPLSHIHSCLNLSQASQLLPRQAPRHAGAGGAGGMTKERVTFSWKVVASGHRRRHISIANHPSSEYTQQWAAALDHCLRSALSTMPARTGFSSVYRG